MESEENALANADKTVKLHPNNADAYYLRFFARIDSVNKAKSSAGDACLKFQKNKTEALKADVLTKLNTVIRILEIQVSDSDKALKLNYAKYSTSRFLPVFNGEKGSLNTYKNIKTKVMNGGTCY